MCGHVLAVFKRPAILKKIHQAGCPKCMISDRRRDTGGGRAPADHVPRCLLVHRLIGKHGRVVPWASAEQPAFAIFSDTGLGDVGVQQRSQLVVTGHGVFLAAFFV